MSAFSGINIDRLPSPNFVENLAYAQLLNARLDRFTEAMQLQDASFSRPVASDPIYQSFAEEAYRELIYRQRINDAAKAITLVYATGADLDHIALRHGVTREEGEADARLRQRARLAAEGLSVAGPEGAYVFHVLNSHPDIADAAVISPEPTEIDAYILSIAGNGEPSSEVLEAVQAKIGGFLPDEDPQNPPNDNWRQGDGVRPLAELVRIHPAEVSGYTVEIELTVYPGPDANLVRQAAEDNVAALVQELRKFGHDITRARLIAAAGVEGVQNVALLSPPADIEVAENQVAFCEGYSVLVVGKDV